MAKASDIAEVRKFLLTAHRHFLVALALFALTLPWVTPAVQMLVVCVSFGGAMAACLAEAWRRRFPVSLPLLYCLIPLASYLLDVPFFSHGQSYAASQGLLLIYLALFGSLYLFRFKIIKYARLEAPVQL